MKNIFKKLILPIFLFAILICSTLYFTYGNKNSMERVKATSQIACECKCGTAPDVVSYGTVDNLNACSSRCEAAGLAYNTCVQVTLVTCGTGQYHTYNSEECLTCKEGETSSPSTTPITTATSCSVCTNNSNVASYSSLCTIASCNAGYKINNNSCVDCAIENATSYSSGCIVSGCKNGYTPNSDHTACVEAPASYSSATAPTAADYCKPNLVYTGAEQQIVSSTSGTGYTLSGYNQKDAGEYTITATLKSGYRWGGSGTGTKEFKCKIDPKSVEVRWSSNSPFANDGNPHSETPGVTLVEGESINVSTGWTREYKKADGTSLGTTAPSDAGSYTVTVTCKDVTGGQAKCSNYTFTNTSASFAIGNAMSLNPTSGTIKVGDTLTFELTNPSGGTVTWTSNHTNIATVNNGVVTGVSVGTAKITAATATGSVEATIVVEAADTPVQNGVVQFEYDNYTCEVGKSIPAVVRYSNIQNPPSSPVVTSSNTSVADVTIITPRACGSTSADVNCVTLDADTIARCRAAGVTEISVERCLAYYQSYFLSIRCKSAGTTTITAAISSDLKAQTTVTANTAGSDISIIFDANGGSIIGDGEPSSSLQITLSGTGTIEEALASMTIIREGYTFAGWFTEDEGGVRYDDSMTFGEIGVEKLYAHWTENNGEEYTLTYDSNGGTACSPATLEVPVNTPWGELCKPSKKGYDFAGWFTSKTGGRKITESVIATENITVYAQWSKTAKDNANTGIVTPVIALLVVALVSSVAFFVVRKKRAQL